MSSSQLWDTIVRMSQPGGWETQLGGAGEKERGPWAVSAEATGGCLTGGLGSHRKVMAGIQAGHITESELISDSFWGISIEDQAG